MTTPKTGTNLVKRGTFTLEAAEKAESEISSGKPMKLKVGRNTVRILPPPVGKTSPFKVVHQHFIHSPIGLVVFACPRVHLKSPCPACGEHDRLKKSVSPTDRKAADDYFANRRIMVNVIDRQDPEAGPKTLAIGKQVYESLLAIRQDEDAGGDYTDPDNGFDIIIEREGTGKEDTKYRVFPARNSTPLGNDEWIEQQADLDKLLQPKTADEIREALAGGNEPPAKTPDAPKPPAGPKRRTAEDDVENPPDGDGVPF